ncbi:sigma-70 family RNA polymerase sigma factor [Leucothrix pacifica]|nr:sigma-70 family RNA polymerase sigma factor [Leucothrix pacifica]
MMEKADLERFISQAALGDQAAFGHIYDATAAKLYSVCLKILKRHDLAEDALQETYIKIWMSADHYQINGLSPMTWLITIARNTAIDKLRSNDAQHHSPDELTQLVDAGQSPEAESLANSDLADAVRSAYLHGSSYADLAERHEVPINTMRTWLRRSLLKLKGCLTND